ncbi:MAG: DNA-processing protein DprA [Clostridia bacterium]|nr:DNA-processing protein DprA [Clostridia bacterium]
MNIADKNILFLDNAIELPYNKKAKILAMFDKNFDLYENFASIRNKISQVLTPKELSFLERSAKQNLKQIIEGYEKDNIKTITINSQYYPQMLKETTDPPFCLYCKGNINLLTSKCIGVVGSRQISDYGKVVTAQFAKEFVRAGLTVVSGMALGVDAVAHGTALENNGATIAVMGSGFNHIYPTANIGLFRQIVQNGLVVTEYPPNSEPLAYNFPVRNRIIAGLSLGVLVTEAGAKSGALHTKNYAVEFGREVFAIPGKITSKESEGTNKIIKQCQSSMVTSPDDIFNELNIKLDEIGKNAGKQLDMTTTSILNYILAEKKTFQEIADFTKLSTRELNNKLIEMQMDGLIIKLAGNAYISAR